MMFPNWAKNILFLLVFMISGLVLILLIEGLSSGTELIPLNTAIERVVMHLRLPVLTSVLVTVTKVSNAYVLLSVATFITVLLIIRRRRYDAVLFIVTMIISVIALTMLKETFQVVRPPSSLIESEGWSFPSGHATIATAFFFMLAYSFFDRMKTLFGKTLLVLGSVSSALLISFSRIYLGAHWTLDILGGIALGLSSVSFVILIFSIFIDNKRSLRDNIRA